jgi:DNA-binding transcriptional MerR regulator
VDDDEMLMIGKFAQLSGLSVGTLRHYDEVGLLLPVSVDPLTGYRWYRRDQLRRAWQIRVLRWIDLPIEEIRQVIDSSDVGVLADGVPASGVPASGVPASGVPASGVPASGVPADGVLARHRRRLERRHSLLAAQIREATRYIEEGITMRSLTTGCRPVQIKIAVDDVGAAVEFYRQAFGLDWEVIRRTEDAEYSGFVFGEYGQEGFFLLVLLDKNSGRLDLPGPSTFSLSVEDLDAYHARALAAGATETVKPHDPGGMPRCSAVRDPSGNWIGLSQA